MIPLRDAQPSNSFPAVTLALIAINVTVFLFQVSLSEYERNYFIAAFALVPARFDVLSLLTAMFLHGGWMHIIGNMWFLWIFGDNVEDILGRGKYLLFYLLSGAAAGLVQVWFNAGSNVPIVGASGAIAGVMGAYLVKFPRSQILVLFWFILIFTQEIPAVVVLGYWFFLQLFNGVGEIGYSQVAKGGVAWFAHAGGFVAGMALIVLMRTRRPYSHRYDLQW